MRRLALGCAITLTGVVVLRSARADDVGAGLDSDIDAGSGARIEPARAAASVQNARSSTKDGAFPFCNDPPIFLSPRAISLCPMAPEIDGCEKLVEACRKLTDKPEPKPWQIPEGVLLVLRQVLVAVFWLFVGGIVVVVGALVIAAIRKSRRDARVAEKVTPVAPTARRPDTVDATALAMGDAETLLARAEEAARLGRAKEALPLYAAAALSALASRGALRLLPSRTLGEYVRTCGETASRPALATIVADVQRVCFGGEAITPEGLEGVSLRAATIVRSGAARLVAPAALTLLVFLAVLPGMSACSAATESTHKFTESDPAGDELPLRVLRDQGMTAGRLEVSLASLPMPEAGKRSPAVVVEPRFVPIDEAVGRHLADWMNAGGTLVVLGSTFTWEHWDARVEVAGGDDRRDVDVLRPMVPGALPLPEGPDSDEDEERFDMNTEAPSQPTNSDAAADDLGDVDDVPQHIDIEGIDAAMVDEIIRRARERGAFDPPSSAPATPDDAPDETAQTNDPDEEPDRNGTRDDEELAAPPPVRARLVHGASVLARAQNDGIVLARRLCSDNAKDAGAGDADVKAFGEATGDAACPDTYAFVRRVGKGKLVAVANGDLFTNIGAAYPGNAEALVALFEWLGPNDVRIAGQEDGIEPPSSPLTGLLRAGFGLGLVHALVATCVLFVATGVRLTRPREPRTEKRRAFVEHIEATGAFYARAGVRGVALSAYSRYAEDQLRSLLRREGGDLAAFVAVGSGKTEAECRAILERARAVRQGAECRGDELETLRDLKALVSAASAATRRTWTTTASASAIGAPTGAPAEAPSGAQADGEPKPGDAALADPTKPSTESSSLTRRTPPKPPTSS